MVVKEIFLNWYEYSYDFHVVIVIELCSSDMLFYRFYYILYERVVVHENLIIFAY